MDTKVDLAALRELLDKATPGPWRESPDTDGDGTDVVAGPPDSGIERVCDVWTGPSADMALIVALRNAAPSLLDEVERQTQAAEAYKAEAVRMGAGWDDARGLLGLLQKTLNEVNAQNATLRAALEKAEAALGSAPAAESDIWLIVDETGDPVLTWSEHGDGPPHTFDDFSEARSFGKYLSQGDDLDAVPASGLSYTPVYSHAYRQCRAALAAIREAK